MNRTGLPTTLFVGTAKAGTTSLERTLVRHPDVGLPRKETFYFDHDLMGGGRLPYPRQRHPRTVVTTEADYRNIYSACQDRSIVEIGTGYLYHHATAIPRVRDLLGSDVRIGIVLRDPVERAWSGYMHFVKDLHETLDFRGALAAEPIRRDEGWDFMWHHLALSRYADQVAAYRSAFKNLRVFFFDDLVADQPSFLREVCMFIGVDPDRLPPVAEARNPSGMPRDRVLQRFITTDNPVKNALRPLVRTLLPFEQRRSLRKFLKSRNLRKSEGPAPEDRTWLRDLLRDDVRRLGVELGQDLFARWKW